MDVMFTRAYGKYKSVPFFDRAHFWLAERKPTHRGMLRQALEKLCSHGLDGLLHAMLATSLFVQSLRLDLFRPDRPQR